MMTSETQRYSAVAWVLAAILTLTACGGGGGSGGGGNDGGADPTPNQPEEEVPDRFTEGRTFRVEPGPDATADMVDAMIRLKPRDTLEFGCGYFDLDEGLLIQATENVRVKGCGKDKTVLSFRDSVNVTGLEALNVSGLVVEGITILDSPGDAFKLKGVKWGTLSDVRALWSGGGGVITKDNYAQRINVACTAPPFNEGDPAPDYVPSSDSGRYGIYPVESENILVENSESIGASDAGIYVGQTNTAIIRDSRAAYNVMGFEIENVQGGEYDNNVAECNTGGFLIYDLENITQYGDTSVMVNNLARNNNTYNFAHSGLVSVVPRGVGFITLGYDNIEVFDNVFEDHSTAAVLYISYELIDGPGNTADKKLDPYTEGLHIHDNVMTNSGYDLPPPDLQKTLAGDIESVLPTLIGLKNLPTLNNPTELLSSLQNLANLGKGAHIIWDGLLDDLDEDCPYPLDAQGNPVPQDENGKPLHTNEHPNPSCHYNAYKFDDQGERKQPTWGSCIHDNELSDDSAPYLNFHGTDGLELVMGLLDQDLSILTPGGLVDIIGGLLNFPSDTRLEDHDCQARFGRGLEPLPRVEIPPFEPSGDYDPATTEEYIAHLCEQEVEEGEVNRAALEVDCPLLSQYNLFADAEDPRSLPHEGGVPFVLNTKLFSDYATKYRVAFIPPGEQAVYRDGQDGNNLNGAIDFPVGTVIAKTFAFTDEANGSEELVETRLLIKRTSQSGKAFWAGLPYIWEQQDGEMVARFAPGGGSRAVHWHYRDANTGQVVSGETAGYSVPNANQCITCHGNDDRPAGSAPIGPKPRNLNRAYQPESTFMGTSGQAGFPRVNQLQYWIDQGLLAGTPDLELDGQGVATNIERLPRWNVPGDGGAAAHSAADVEQRVRAYLEVNCQHCHNDKGAASNTGYYLDHYRDVDAGYGVCKKPTATGGGSCGRQHVLVPGSSADSIVACRLAAENDPQRMMPPIARSVAHDEASALMNQWIDTVVDGDYTNAGGCTN
ncbi:parallel beta-helix domain-containing protein [Alloalcanivorax marinus]|uniref:parallel beta-helix domain-containing protein n=1 Tax=Alloalcanivorax marinus TaxID=1177169 RepID=UPI001EE49D67|nr:parallel beta-helix domain-containing protein [Alloalcanivorax marinus]